MRRDRVLHGGGGVAILIRNTLRYRVVHNLRDCNGRLEVCAVELALRDGGMLLVSCYRPPGESGISSLEGSSFLSQFNGRFLIGGDFNAHHSFWGDFSECSVGRDIVGCMDSQELAVLNDGQLTFCSASYDAQSVINLTFVDCRSALEYGWVVSDDTWGSDHFPIFIQFSASPLSGLRHRPKRKLYTRATDWFMFLGPS